MIDRTSVGASSLWELALIDVVYDPSFGLNGRGGSASPEEPAKVQPAPFDSTFVYSSASDPCDRSYPGLLSKSLWASEPCLSRKLYACGVLLLGFPFIGFKKERCCFGCSRMLRRGGLER